VIPRQASSAALNVQSPEGTAKAKLVEGRLFELACSLPRHAQSDCNLFERVLALVGDEQGAIAGRRQAVLTRAALGKVIAARDVRAPRLVRGRSAAGDRWESTAPARLCREQRHGHAPRRSFSRYENASSCSWAGSPVSGRSHRSVMSRSGAPGGRRSMCARMSGCSFSRRRMFETRTGPTLVCLAMAAPLRKSPLSMSDCHSRASAKSRTICGSSRGSGAGGSERLAGFETTKRKFLLPSPLGRRSLRDRSPEGISGASLRLRRSSGLESLLSVRYARSVSRARRHLGRSRCLRQLSWLESLLTARYARSVSRARRHLGRFAPTASVLRARIPSRARRNAKRYALVPSRRSAFRRSPLPGHPR